MVEALAAMAALLPQLAEWMLKGSLVLIAALALTVAIRHRSAAERHAIWTIAVVAQLGIPALTLVLPSWSVPLLPTSATLGSSSRSAPAIPLHLDHSLSSPDASASRIDPAAPVSGGNPDTGIQSLSIISTAEAMQRVGWREWFVLIWLSGTVLALLHLAAGTRGVWRIARRADRITDAQWLSLAQQTAVELGILRPVTLLRASRFGVPVTCGIVYPVVLLPPEADGWPAERRRAVLLHELAHVRRLDALTQVVAQFAVALFWLSPLVWLAAARMRSERERACDDVVLSAGIRPSDYVHQILEFVRSPVPRSEAAFAALAMARPSGFEERMRAILNSSTHRGASSRRSVALACSTTIAFVLPLAAMHPWRAAAAEPVAAHPSLEDRVDRAAAGQPVPSSEPEFDANPDTDSAYPATAAGPMRREGETDDDWRRFCAEPSDAARRTMLVLADGRREITLDEPGRCLHAALRGDVVLTDDDAGVARVSAGGRLRVVELDGGTERSLLVSTAANGPPVFTNAIDGAPAPFDQEVQAWLTMVMPVLIEEAGMGAAPRAERLYRRGGISEALDEVRRLKAEHVRRAHLEGLALRVDLSTAERISVIHFASEVLPSDGDRAAIFTRLAVNATPAVRKEIRAAAAHISSEGDRRAVLQALGAADESTR